MTISTTSSKVTYAGNGSTKTFNVNFYFLDATHLQVVLRAADGTETTKVLNTDYTVSGAGNPAGGSITMGTAPASGQKLVIARSTPLTQTVDYQPNDPFPANTHEGALDKLTMITQQLQEQVDRSAKLPISSAADAASLSADILRLGDSADNIDAVANDLTNINSVAANATNINTVAGKASDVTTVAGIASNVTTVAGMSSAISTVNSNATNINAVAGNSTNINAVATNSTNINAVNSNKTNIDTVAGANSNISTVAGISANVTTVATNATAVSTNATNITAITTNASNITAIQNAATNAATATTQAGIATTQAGIATTQAGNASNSAALAAAAAAAGLYSKVVDKSANYSVVLADNGSLIRGDTSGGAITITLPLISSVIDGFKVAVVKWTGDTNGVNIARSGSDTINGNTSASVGTLYSSTTFVADFETNTWFAVSSGLGSTNVVVDQFSGNASTTAFTLSGDPGNKQNTNVYVSGVHQDHTTYSVSGATLTFSSAPPSGTGNIEVVWTQPLAIGVPADNTVSDTKLTSSLRASITGKSVAMAIVFGG